MNDGEQWYVTVVEDDALLFAASADGTVSMRAVHRTDWDAILAANEASGRRQLMGDVIRRVVGDDVASATGSETHVYTRAAMS